jgi:hypothetical protein
MAGNARASHGSCRAVNGNRARTWPLRFANATRLGAAEHQRAEVGTAIVVESDQLAVEDGALGAEDLRDIAAEGRPGSEDVTVPRDEAAAAAVDERERAEAVELDGDPPRRVVEGLADAAERHRRERAAMVHGVGRRSTRGTRLQ